MAADDMTVAPGRLPALHGLGVTARRLYVLTGAPPTATTPAAGADVDGVGGLGGTHGFAAVPGIPVKIEAGGSFSSGASLQTDSSGRVVVASSGNKIIARALEAGTLSAVVWCVFVAQKATA